MKSNLDISKADLHPAEPAAGEPAKRGRKQKSETGDKPSRKPPVNKLNDLNAKEWIPETVSVWTQRGLGKGHAHAQIERQHPAPFSYQDVLTCRQSSIH